MPKVLNQDVPRVRNMDSPRTGKPVANQYIIDAGEMEIFQSYDSIIAVKTGGNVFLDPQYWDYSVTTGKYRNEFLGESIAETRRKIDDGTYKLADLN